MKNKLNINEEWAKGGARKIQQKGWGEGINSLYSKNDNDIYS